MSAYTEAATTIAKVAGTILEMSPAWSYERALLAAADAILREASFAAARRGIYASEVTTEALEAIAFKGAVAADILDGTVSRPSTGNVREYAADRLFDYQRGLI